MANALVRELERDLDNRRDEGLQRIRRTLDSAQGTRPIVDGARVLAFASNDYLGLACDPALVAAAREGAERWGVGAGASHLAGGHQAPHAALEARLAAFVAPDARALLFSTGYLANLAIVTALADRETAVFADRLNHACLNDAVLLARAQHVRYPHGDVDALAARLRASTARRKVIATDAVFSMDGDLAPLPALLELAEAHDAWLVVDDAHGFGVLGDGRGTPSHFGLRSERLVHMGTLGKAAGVAGAFACAHPAVIETIVQRARPYVFTTAAPAMLACALLASLDLIEQGAARRQRLVRSVARLRERMEPLRWKLLPSQTPIQALVVGGNDSAVALASHLWSQRIYVPAMRPPTVPRGTARLRISLSAAHTDDDVDALATALRSA